MTEIISQSQWSDNRILSKLKWRVADLYHLFVPKKHEAVTDLMDYKVDAGMSTQQKLHNGWREREFVLEQPNIRRLIIMLQKDISTKKGRGRVLEYADYPDVPPHLIGQQLYDQRAVEALWLVDDLPTNDDLDTIIALAGWEQAFIQKYFQKDGQSILPGYCDHTEYIMNTDKTISCWTWLPMADSGVVKSIGGAQITENYMTYQQTHPKDFLSLFVRKK